MGVRTVLVALVLVAGSVTFSPLRSASAVPIGGVTVAANTPINFNAAAGAAILTDGVIEDNDWLTAPNLSLGWSDPLWNIDPAASSDSGVPQPRLTFDLGGLYLVNSVTVHYIVDQIAGDDTRNLRAPDSMAASFSVSGAAGPFLGSVVETGWDDTDDMAPAPGVGAARSLTTNLGMAASAVQLDFLTNGEWMFISEISFDGVAIPEPSTSTLLCGLGGVLAFRRRP